jgi:serine protease Do
MRFEFREIVNWARRRKLVVTLLVSATLGVGILIGTLVSGPVGAALQQGTMRETAATLAVPNPVQLSSTFAAISQKVESAVVNISTTAVRPQPQRSPRRQTPSPFEEFPFERFFGNPEDGPSAERSLGSGAIVDRQGYILTNNHVVDQATKIEVRLMNDPRPYTARVVGVDFETDLAVIKIDAGRALPTIPLGNSDAVQVGDWVLAFGSPFGLEATVTAGIISAKDRASVAGAQQFQRFLQTDAAINPGNSGGPLVNMAGEVIGINTAIMTSRLSRGFEGVGFALPSNTAIHVYNQIIKHGRVTRGSIGISFNEQNSRNPVALQELGAPHGMIIEAVEEGSPAAKAGLREGDVVTHVNGQPVRIGPDLVDPITRTPVGNKVKLSIVRDGKKREIEVAVADRSELFPETAGRADARREEEPVATEFGLRVGELAPALAQQFGLDSSQGVLVTGVDPASFAESLGLGRGDLILEVNRVPVNSAADFRRELSKLKPGSNVILKVLRRDLRGRVLTVFPAGVVPPPEA